MIALFHAAQIERVLVLVGDDVAEAVDIERARGRKVGHAELDVARAHDVERRIEDGIAQGHCVCLAVTRTAEGPAGSTKKGPGLAQAGVGRDDDW